MITLKEAYEANLLDKVQMMELAYTVSQMHKGKRQIIDFDDVYLNKDTFVLKNTFFVRRKDILINFPSFLIRLKKVIGVRLTNIFLTFYLAYQDDWRILKHLPHTETHPFVMAIGGLSGSGKSRLARELSPHIASPVGTLVIRTDLIRHRLMETEFSKKLPKKAFTPKMERRVNSETLKVLKKYMKTNYPIIVEGIFYHEEQRKKIEKIVSRRKYPFLGVWTFAPLPIRTERMAHQTETFLGSRDDLVKQMRFSFGKIDWMPVSTDRPSDETVRTVLKLFKDNLKI